MRGLCRFPLVVSPMAGGPSTVDLVVASGAAGALGFLAGGYVAPDGLSADITAVREAGCQSFGVNLFVPGRPTGDPAGLAAYLERLAPDAAALGATLGEPSWDDDRYEAKLEAVLAAAPPVVSFTFGRPDADAVRALRAVGSLVVLTVTTPEEAASALVVEPDALCLQGSEAGAHRGSFANDDRPDQDRPVRALLAAVRRRTLVPLIAAGGVAGPRDVAELVAGGATMVQAGTLFVPCAESGAHPSYKAALTGSAFAATSVTRAFSGRRARALVSDMVRTHVDAPKAYPEINNATRPLRAAAAAAGDLEHMSLYAGSGFGQAQARPTADVVAHLVSELPS
jgi:nitronate monooxygenase